MFDGRAGSPTHPGEAGCIVLRIVPRTPCTEYGVYAAETRAGPE